MVGKLRDLGEHELADSIERKRSRTRPLDPDKAATGDTLAASGNIRRAIAAYREAGAYDKLISLGDARAAVGNPRGVNEAHQAYVAAGATERLRALADGAVGRGWFDTALRSFIAASDREGAERVGDAILHKAGPTDDLYIQQLHLVLRAYRYAGARRKLVELGRKFVAINATEDALSAFRSAARLEEPQAEDCS